MTQPALQKPPSRIRRELNDLKQQIGLWHVVGVSLTLSSVGITIYLAFRGQSETFPGSPVTLAVLAVIAQAGAAATFAYSTRFDPRYAQSALAHLSTLSRQAGDAVKSTQEIIEANQPNPAIVLERLRTANVALSYIQDSALDAADNWLRVLNSPLKRIETVPGSQPGKPNESGTE